MIKVILPMESLIIEAQQDHHPHVFSPTRRSSSTCFSSNKKIIIHMFFLWKTVNFIKSSSTCYKQKCIGSPRSTNLSLYIPCRFSACSVSKNVTPLHTKVLIFVMETHPRGITLTLLVLTKSCSSSVTENTNLNKNKLKSGTHKTNPIRWEALIMTASLS